jgi:anti-sigma B factor antagonist
MKIKLVEKQNAVVIELMGNIMDGSCFDVFKEKIKELISQGKTNIVIDLGEVIHMNSLGLGMLISGYISLKNVQGNLKLARITEKIEKLLDVTKLITIFEYYSSIDDAVSSYNK